MPTDREDGAWIAALLSEHAADRQFDPEALLARVTARDVVPAGRPARHPDRDLVAEIRVGRARSRPPRGHRPRLTAALTAAALVAVAATGSLLSGVGRSTADRRPGVVDVAGDTRDGVTPTASGSPTSNPVASSGNPTSGTSAWSPVASSGSLGPNPPSTSVPAASTRPPVNARAGLPSRFRWTSGGSLIGPGPGGVGPAGALKDPSVVFSGGRWHVFADVAGPTGYSLVYLSFTDWSQAGSATQHRLDTSGIGPGYRAAPQVFYFAPQRLWYLVFQTGNASYSTNPDISDPAGWSAPKNFYPRVPSAISRSMGAGFWVDMWVICDDVDCHLFSFDGNGHLFRSKTRVADFPNGMSEPVVALQGADRLALLDAGNVYRIAGTDRYLLLAEAIGGDGRHYLRSWTSTSLDGAWSPLAATQDEPFAGAANVRFDGKEWTHDVSQGELLRAGHDQSLTVSPCNLRFLFEGVDPKAGGPYNGLPWRLGLLTQTNPAPGCG